MSNNDCVKEFKNECTLRAAFRGSVTELGNMYLILTAPSVSLVSTSVCIIDLTLEPVCCKKQQKKFLLCGIGDL